MKADHVNALSSAIIAFVTVLGLMGGFYYNMRTYNVPLFIILNLETFLFITILIFASWVTHKLKKEGSS